MSRRMALGAARPMRALSRRARMRRQDLRAGLGRGNEAHGETGFTFRYSNWTKGFFLWVRGLLTPMRPRPETATLSFRIDIVVQIRQANGSGVRICSQPTCNN